jgi:hypothetical protein
LINQTPTDRIMEANDNKKNYQSSKSDYDKTEAKTGHVAAIGIVGILLLVIAMYWIFQYFRATTEKQMERAALTPSMDLEQLHAREDSILSSYGVIDSAKGIYQIPIQQAMKIMADSVAEKH